MARQKVEVATVLRSWDDVDAAGKDLGERKRRVEAAEAKANARIDEIKTKLAGDTSEDLAMIQRHEADIQAFTVANQDGLTGRSRKLNFIHVFLKASSSLKTASKWTWAMVLDRLTERGRSEFIRVKEEVDKEAIRAADLPVEQLTDLGMRLVTEDSFSYELPEVTAQPTT